MKTFIQDLLISFGIGAITTCLFIYGASTLFGLVIIFSWSNVLAGIALTYALQGVINRAVRGATYHYYRARDSYQDSKE